MASTTQSGSARSEVLRMAAVGMGLFAAQFTWVIFNTYVPLFLQAGSAAFDALQAGNSGRVLHGFGLSAAQTGLVMSLDNWAALLLLPLAGLLSDRTRTRRGRRLPYLLAGMPAAALGIAALPLLLPPQAGSPERYLPAFLAALLAAVAAMAVWRAPLFALMADLTPSAQRARANGILNLMAGLGGVLAFGAGSLLYAAGRPLPFWTAGLILVLACALIAARVREPAAAAHPPAPWRAWLAGWRQAAPRGAGKSLALLSAAVFSYMMGFHPIEAFFSSYGVSVLKLSQANSGLVLSAAYIAFILAAVPAGLLSMRIGRRRTVLVGLVLFAGALLAAYRTPLVGPLVGLMALGGVGWALVDINGFAMVLDSIPERGGGRMGTASAVYFLAATLAAAVGPVLNGWLIDATGRNYATIFLIGPAFFGIAFACMALVRHGEAQEAPIT